MADGVCTPERARTVSRRWLWAAVIVGVAGAALNLAGFDMFRTPLLLVVFLCAQESANHAGWRRGWLARDRQAGDGRG